MLVTVSIDQRAAIRRGYNATSTAKLDVDVATLTPTQRDRFAAHFDDGWLRNGFGGLEEPTVGALVARLDQLDQQERANKAQKEAVAHDEFLKLKAAPPETRTQKYSCDGEVVHWDGEYQVRVSYIHRTTYHGTAYHLSPEDKAAYHDWQAQVNAENEARLAAALAAAAPEFAAARQAKADAEAARQAADAARKAAITTTINTLGSDAQKARLARGLMKDPYGEAITLATDAAFQPISLAAATPPDPEDIPLPEEFDCPEHYDVERAEGPEPSLTDEEMVAFLAAEKLIQTALPAAKVQPWRLRVTRDHSDIPWHGKTVVRVTLPHDLGELTRDFELP